MKPYLVIIFAAALLLALAGCEAEGRTASASAGTATPPPPPPRSEIDLCVEKCGAKLCAAMLPYGNYGFTVCSCMPKYAPCALPEGK